MGTFKHHAIVVTAPSYYDMKRAHRMAKKCCPDLVSPVVKSHINGWVSFFVAPDGSKEGWGESTQGDEGRDKLIHWLNRQRWDDGSTPLAWVEVEYGERYQREGAAVTRHFDSVNIGEKYRGPHDLDSGA